MDDGREMSRWAGLLPSPDTVLFGSISVDHIPTSKK